VKTILGRELSTTDYRIWPIAMGKLLLVYKPSSVGRVARSVQLEANGQNQGGAPAALRGRTTLNLFISVEMMSVVDAIDRGWGAEI